MYQIKKDKLHNFAYELYVMAKAREIERSYGIDFDEALKNVKSSLNKSEFKVEINEGRCA